MRANSPGAPLGVLSRATRPVGEAAWQSEGYKLFISHPAQERKKIAELAAALQRYSIEAFVAHEMIWPTSEWLEVIEEALRSCDALVAYLHPGFRESDWCDQEIGFAMACDVPIVSVCFGRDPYGFMARYQGIFLDEDYSSEDTAEQLFEILARGRDTKVAMAEALVRRFEATSSFHSGRSNLDNLRRIPAEAWSPRLIARARAAACENSQLRDLRAGSEMGPETLEAILLTAP